MSAITSIIEATKARTASQDAAMLAQAAKNAQGALQWAMAATLYDQAAEALPIDQHTGGETLQDATADQHLGAHTQRAHERREPEGDETDQEQALAIPQVAESPRGNQQDSERQHVAGDDELHVGGGRAERVLDRAERDVDLGQIEDREHGDRRAHREGGPAGGLLWCCGGGMGSALPDGRLLGGGTRVCRHREPMLRPRDDKPGWQQLRSPQW